MQAHTGRGVGVLERPERFDGRAVHADQLDIEAGLFRLRLDQFAFSLHDAVSAVVKLDLHPGYEE